MDNGGHSTTMSASSASVSASLPIISKLVVVTFIGPGKNENRVKSVTVESYPEGSEEGYENLIPSFCFPENDQSKILNDNGPFVFTMTDNNGVRQYGYCKRRMQDKSNFPECICIMSHYPWFSMFYRVLEIAESKRRKSSPLSSLYSSISSIPHPSPGEKFTFTIKTSGLEEKITLSRPDDTKPIQYHIDYSDLFMPLSESKVLKLFACALMERRIMFIGSKLGQLSCAIHALVSLLNPFTWQHIFIPILPESLLDYCFAPIPYIIGIHSSYSERLMKSSLISEVFVVDLDKGRIMCPHNDLDLLPTTYLAELKATIHPYFALKNEKLFQSIDPNQISVNSSISGSFLNFLSIIFGKYDQFFDKDHNFQYDKFLESHPKILHPFLTNFKGCQMYVQFIEDRSKRRAHGVEIGFQKIGQEYSNFQRIAIGGRVAGIKLKAKARTMVVAGKEVTQEVLRKTKDIGPIVKAFEPLTNEPLKMFLNKQNEDNDSFNLLKVRRTKSDQVKSDSGSIHDKFSDVLPTIHKSRSKNSAEIPNLLPVESSPPIRFSDFLDLQEKRKVNTEETSPEAPKEVDLLNLNDTTNDGTQLTRSHSDDLKDIDFTKINLKVTPPADTATALPQKEQSYFHSYSPFFYSTTMSPQKATTKQTQPQPQPQPQAQAQAQQQTRLPSHAQKQAQTQAQAQSQAQTQKLTSLTRSVSSRSTYSSSTQKRSSTYNDKNYNPFSDLGVVKKN